MVKKTEDNTIDEKKVKIDTILLKQSVLTGLFILVIMILLAFLADWLYTYQFVDILFFEGMIALLSGFVYVTGGFPLGVSTKGLGQKNPQADAGMQLEIHKKEEEIQKNKIQSSSKVRKFMLGILFAGAVCTLIDIILVML